MKRNSQMMKFQIFFELFFGYYFHQLWPTPKFKSLTTFITLLWCFTSQKVMKEFTYKNITSFNVNYHISPMLLFHVPWKTVNISKHMCSQCWLPWPWKYFSCNNISFFLLSSVARRFHSRKIGNIFFRKFNLCNIRLDRKGVIIPRNCWFAAVICLN